MHHLIFDTSRLNVYIYDNNIIKLWRDLSTFYEHLTDLFCGIGGKNVNLPIDAQLTIEAEQSHDVEMGISMLFDNSFASCCVNLEWEVIDIHRIDLI